MPVDSAWLTAATRHAGGGMQLSGSGDLSTNATDRISRRSILWRCGSDKRALAHELLDPGRVRGPGWRTPGVSGFIAEVPGAAAGYGCQSIISGEVVLAEPAWGP